MAGPNDEIYDAIRKADAAGDGESVKKLAAYLDQQGAAPSDAPVGSSELHTYQTRGPKGKLVQFQGPADASDEDIRKLAVQATGSRAYAGSIVKRDGSPLPQTDDSAGRGFLLGAAKPLDFLGRQLDKIPGVEAVDRALSPDGRSATEQHADYADAVQNNTRTGYQTLGNIAGVAPLALVPGANTTLLGMVGTGAAGGALLSNSDTAGGIATDAAVGGVVGGIGGKIVAPLASKALGAIARGTNRYAIQPVANAVRSAVDPTAEAVSSPKTSKAVPILLKALLAQGQTPTEAVGAVTAARARGVPLALMDTGDETRGLASALSRAPGESRTTIRGAVLPRQDAQLDRVQGAITDNLGPVANVREQSAALMKDASTKATPLYEAFRAEPSRTSPELESLLATPAGKSAIARARTIAANDRVDPNKLGFDLDEQGEVQLVKNPSPQTLDYVKRGLDDVVEDNRDKTTGRLVLNTAQRAENNVRHSFVSEMDKLYPDTYPAARQAFAGPAAAAAALQKGASISAKDAETVAAETANLSPSELEQYKLGVRSALSKALEGRVDGGDKVKALVGSPKKRMVLAKLFGGEANFGKFMDTLGDEGQAAATYGRVNTGSMTAANLADDGNMESLAGVAAKAGARAISGHGIVGNALATLHDLYRYGAGEAGSRVKAELAKTISSMDPDELAAFQNAAEQLNQARLGDLARTNVIRRGAVPAATASQSRLR
jgi:hypothetical protein